MRRTQDCTFDDGGTLTREGTVHAMSNGVVDVDRPSGLRWPWAAILALPLVGLALLLVQPQLDLHWEHHPSHFWLVLSTAAVSSVLAYVTNVAATRHRDARLVLVSMAFLATAGFLGLHALATPGVLLPASNTGFAIATPIGLAIGAGFAAASASPLAGPRAHTVLRRRAVMLGGLSLLMVIWGVVSLAGLPPLDGPPPAKEAAGPLAVLAVVGTILYSAAAWRYLEIYQRRGGVVTIAVAVAFVLLAQALIAVATSRNWQLSWWEWHVLMLLAFAAIALGAREEYRRSRSLTAAFGGLYLEATLARIDRWHARAIASVAAAGERGDGTEPVLAILRREGASSDEVALMVRAASEVQRLDASFRPYLPSPVTQRLRRGRSGSAPGGEERQVSVIFADLAGFTTFSETRRPTEVLSMLNEYWAQVVPAIEAAERGHRALCGRRRDGHLQRDRRPARPCAAGRGYRPADRRHRADPGRSPRRLAAVPGRGQHRAGGHRRCGRGGSTQLRGHRRHDQRRGAAGRRRSAWRGGRRGVDVAGARRWSRGFVPGPDVGEGQADRRCRVDPAVGGAAARCRCYERFAGTRPTDMSATAHASPSSTLPSIATVNPTVTDRTPISGG